MRALPMTGALSPLAAQQGFDLTPLALAEMEFERKLQETRDWLKSTRVSGQDIAPLSEEGVRP